MFAAFAACLISACANRPPEWLYQPPFDGYSNATCLSQGISGRLYMAGEGDNGSQFLTAVSDSGEPVWSIVWEAPASGGGIYRVNNVVESTEGYIYLTGAYWRTVDFNSGDDEDFNTSSDGWDTFLMKLDMNGDFMWCRTWDGYEIAEEMVGEGPMLYMKLAGLAIDSQGSIYISYSDLRKYSSDGEMVWVEPIAGCDIAIDSRDLLYVAGRSCVSKINCNGQTLWSTDRYSRFGDAQEFAMAISLDEYCNVYACTSHGEIKKYDLNGDLTWSSDLRIYPEDLEVDQEGRVYVVGAFSDERRIEVASEYISLTPRGSRDSFLGMIDDSGELQWIKTWGSPDSYTTTVSLVTGPSGWIYIAGYYKTRMMIELNGSEQTFTSDAYHQAYLVALRCEVSR